MGLGDRRVMDWDRMSNDWDPKSLDEANAATENSNLSELARKKKKNNSKPLETLKSSSV